MNTNQAQHKIAKVQANRANALLSAKLELSNFHLNYNQQTVLPGSVFETLLLTSMIKNSVKLLIGVLLIFSFIQPGFAAGEKPLWEYGIGTVGWYGPDYLGADQQQAFLLPIPYFVYRGEIFRADREGLRGLLFSSEKLDLNISVSAALPVDSEDNDAREGMDDLNFMIEVGPTLQYQLLQTDNQQLRFDLPVRAAFTLGSEFLNHQGWTTNPRFQHKLQLQEWDLTTSAGLVFSDRRYHGYIYDVDQKDVRPDRPFYQSSSGFTGSRFSFSIKRQFGDLYIGALFSYNNLSGATNSDSPLLKEHDYLSAGMIIAWVLGRSKKKI